ncbi:MAG: transposase, partial [Desulfobacterales bacterium]
HKREFLLKFARDRRRWLYWMFEAKKRYGLCILDYAVTSNHIHLLVEDNGGAKTIARSIQLAAGRTAQEFNRRKGRKGAFWEDRYHATAVETGQHLCQCLVYIDMNMVRAGAVTHPREWAHGGYREIQYPRQRYRLVDRERLRDLSGSSGSDNFFDAHASWVEEALRVAKHQRDTRWTESVAVGSRPFVETIRMKLGHVVRGRKARETSAGWELREDISPYNTDFSSQNGGLRPENLYLWNETVAFPRG